MQLFGSRVVDGSIAKVYFMKRFAEMFLVIPSTLKEIKDDGFEVAENSRVMPPNMPEVISIRSLQSNVKNQRQGSFCTAFGVIAATEFVVKNGINGTTPVPGIDLSEAHVIHASEKIGGDCKPGGKLSQALRMVFYNGVVGESVWPYDDKVCCSPSPPNLIGPIRYFFDVRPKVLFHREHSEVVENIKLVVASEMIVNKRDNVSIIRQALFLHKVTVVIDVPVFWYGDGLDAGWEDGKVKMPTPIAAIEWLESDRNTISTPPGAAGWHVICVTGYDDINRCFEFKNSWGVLWGDRGFGTISYEYVANFSRAVWEMNVGYRVSDRPPEYGI